MVEEVIEARDLVNKSEVIDVHLWLRLNIWDIHEDFRPLFLQVDDQVLQLLLVYFEVLHNHVVAKSVTLVPILPIVHVVVESLLIEPVHMDTIAMKTINYHRGYTYR